MGKGANKSISFGLGISDRKSSSSNSNPEVSSAKANSIGNNNNLDRPYDCGGPTGSNSGGANEVVMVDHKSSPSYYYLSADAKNSSIATSYNSQPFHVFSANPYNIPGEKMVPLFTNAQYTELERQAMIYKYMISSLPVPPHLLHALYVNNVGNWRNGGCGVVEAGRCKRTDGKKWRCSRDVAPHQKYCERHLHRGRPRSRKPVENHKNTCTTTTTDIAVDENHKKPRLDQQNDDLMLNASVNNRDVGFWAMNEGAFLGFAPNEGYNWEMQANNNGPMMGGWVDSSHNEQVQNYVKMDHDYVNPEFCWGPLAEALFRNPPMTSTTL